MKNLTIPQPVFFQEKLKSLYLNELSNDPTARAFLIGNLRRFPNNLTRHIQRINYESENNNREGLCGAILDLFIILGQNGLPLRTRVLEKTRTLLGEPIYQQLKDSLGDGIDSYQTILPSCRSSFSSDFCGHRHFIKKTLPNNTNALSDYEQAISLIEYGELEEACTLLEQLVRKDSQNNEAASLLLDIYERQQQEAAIQTLAIWFMENDRKPPECWPLFIEEDNNNLPGDS